MERSRALEILGLGPGAELDVVKRRFRALVHDLHPDRGGDARAFHDLQLAYRLLCEELDGPARPAVPRVARGRPSRVLPDAPPEDLATPRTPIAPLSRSERQRLSRDRRVRIDAELFARLLVSEPDRVPVQAGTIAGRLTARAPRRRARGLRTLVAIGAPSSLTVSTRPAALRVELAARSRAARRTVADLDLGVPSRAPWLRQRGDAVTVLVADIPRGPSVDETARRVTGAVIELLDALAWPLEMWRIDARADR